MTMNFTGERFVPGMEGVIEAEHLHRYLMAREIASGLDVLDVASGEGYGSHLLSAVARSVVGVDIAEVAVDHAREKYQAPNLRYIQGDCTKLPLKNASVDLVVSFETIEHHDQHEAMLKEIRRVLRPGGLLLISSPNRPEYDKTLSEPNIYHVKELDFPEFEVLLRGQFPNVEFYAQRVMNGSMVVPFMVPVEAYRHYSNETDALQFPMPRPIYFVALASDSQLPSMGVSMYELQNGIHLEAPDAVAEVRLYISEVEHGNPTAYSEARGAALLYPVNSVRQTLNLTLPSDLKTVDRLRLDVANQPLAVVLHEMVLEALDGQEIWRWSGGRGLFQNVFGLVLHESTQGLMGVCLNDDPQFDIAIPSNVLGMMRGGSVLRLELTPSPLLDQLPQVLAQGLQSPLPVLAGAHIPAGFSAVLDELSVLMREKLERKNAMISAQKAEIESLHIRQQVLYEQIVRAEAQLELLKEFALPDVGSRLERL